MRKNDEISRNKRKKFFAVSERLDFDQLEQLISKSHFNPNSEKEIKVENAIYRRNALCHSLLYIPKMLNPLEFIKKLKQQMIWD